MTKKKTQLIVSLLFLLTIIISAFAPISAIAAESNYKPRLEAPNSSISYYSRAKNVYFQTGYGMPNCVAYAYGRVYEMNGEKPLINHGSAGDWYFINKANNYYEYGSTPKLGAVACWSRHVAVVEKINKNGSVTLSESHWGGSYFDTVTYSNMNSHYGQTFYGYIYTYNECKLPELDELQKAALKKKKPSYKKEIVVAPDETSQFNIIKLNNDITANEKELILARF